MARKKHDLKAIEREYRLREKTISTIAAENGVHPVTIARWAKKNDWGNRSESGRPTKFSDDLANEIVVRIATGESLIGICKDEHMPNEITVQRWLSDGREQFVEFRSEYVRARERQADHFFEEITEIRKQTQAGKIGPNEARVAIDAIKWQAGKLRGKYNDRVVVDQNIRNIDSIVNDLPDE